MFVTAAQPHWPDTIPGNFNVPESVTVLPDADPDRIFETHSVIYLKPGALYRWPSITLTRAVTIYGNNAIIELVGAGPQLHVHPPSWNNDVDTNVAIDLKVTLRDIIFRGSDSQPDRQEAMSAKFVEHSAVWIDNAWRTTIENCSFLNYKGSAIWYQDDVKGLPTGIFEAQHILTNCRFRHCRIGVSNAGRSEYSMASNNLFADCQICFNVIGGNWLRVGNHIVSCRCAYYHTTVPWYIGRSGNQNAAHGTFCSNSVNHCTTACLWPSSFMQANGVRVDLAGFYFSDGGTYPPNWTGNTHYYFDMILDNMSTQKSFKWTICGCVLMNCTITTRNNTGNSTYIFGCTGNSDTRIGNVPAGNISPDIGTTVYKKSMEVVKCRKRIRDN